MKIEKKTTKNVKEPEKKEGRQFRIIGTGGETIPWHIAEEAYKEYSRQYGTEQSLERIAERGGFGVYELAIFLYARIKNNGS